MKRLLGAVNAKKLKSRLADLRAAGCIFDLPLTPRIKLNGGEPLLEIEPSAGLRLILCINHNNPPKLKSGEIDWEKVFRLKVIRIEHECN